MEIKRGDIFYIDASGYVAVGSEQRPGRPAVIVSNDRNNRNSSTVEVVYFTTQPKANLPTHVRMESCNQSSIAICEQITTVSKERIGSYKGHVTDAEMTQLETAMLISLDLFRPAEQAPESQTGGDENCAKLEVQLAECEAKCRTLQEMYEALLNRLIKC